MNLETRTAQVLAVTEREREELDENNPIIFAESGPNRFRSMSWFFPEEDGVELVEDIDTNTITVKYFNNEISIDLEEGSPLWCWATEIYEND